MPSTELQLTRSWTAEVKLNLKMQYVASMLMLASSDYMFLNEFN